MSKTYSTTIEITEEKEYSVTINTGLNLSAWIVAGSTTDHPLNPSSYANFAALEADEKAIRQLMLVHNAVDYLATAKAGDSLMQSVINSNVCAKWINLSDYALDTLSAKSNIKSVMDAADKYAYGEWGKINSTTWGSLGNVPIMTANNAPYGTVASSAAASGYDAYKAFDGNVGTTSATKGFFPSGSTTNEYLAYTFINPANVRRVGVFIVGTQSVNPTINLIASNDGFSTEVTVKTNILGGSITAGEWHYFDIPNDDYYMSYAIRGNMNIAGYGWKLQFYGRELTVKQTSAPTDGREYIHIGSDYYTEDWGEKEFAQGSTRKTIYDHGVELETITSHTTGTGQSVEKRPNCLYGYKSSNNGAFNIYPVDSIDLTDFNVMCSKTGNIAVGTCLMLIYDNMPITTANEVARATIAPPITYLPVDSVSGNNAPVIYGGANDSTVRQMTISEWWLE